MTRTVINAGICGMTTTVEVVKIGKQQVGIKITSNCEMVAKMNETLAKVNLRKAFKTLTDSIVYKCASEYCLHTVCPVPMAILKAIEIEAGLALPQPVLINFETALQRDNQSQLSDR